MLEFNAGVLGRELPIGLGDIYSGRLPGLELMSLGNAPVEVL
jgi:hypothetical protein